MTSHRVLLAAHNIRPKKRLGQNFIINPDFVEMIVNRSAISSKDIVLEIGAGLGALTIPLARRARKVLAVERDQHIIGILKTEILANGLSNIDLIEKNILAMDIIRLAETIGEKIIVMGNLPYNISSQVLVQLIKSRKMVSRAVLMLQKEMARRICAQPGCKDYGRLTVMLHYSSNIKKLADANASLFFPKPKIDSEILEIKFRQKIAHLANDEAFFFKVIKAAFGNRRKTLKNSLAGSELNLDPKTAKHILESLGIDPVRRAETLNTEEFVKLSNKLNFISAG